MRIVAAVFLLAASELPPQLDAHGRAEMAARHLPGVVVAISRDGVIAEHAWGVANVELDVPFTAKHLFPIASATKPFPSVLIFSLVRERQISSRRQSWRDITVRQLLSHTTGLPDVTVKPGSAELIANTGDEAFAKLRTMPLQFPPGTQWAYNQTNYALLQLIAEKLTG